MTDYYFDSGDTHRLELFNPEGRLAMVQNFHRHHLAWCAGENWNMLTAGNSYQIVPGDLNVGVGDCLPDAVRRAEEWTRND